MLAIVPPSEGHEDDQTVRTLNAYFQVQEYTAYERHALHQLRQEPGEDAS